MGEHVKKRLSAVDNYLQNGTQTGQVPEMGFGETKGSGGGYIDKVSRAKALLVKTPLNWKENMEWNFRVNSCDTLHQLASLCN